MRPYKNKSLWRLNPSSGQWEFQRKCLRGSEQEVFAEALANQPLSKFVVSVDQPLSKKQAEHRKQIRKGGKHKLFAEIRVASETAVKLRKQGLIPGALRAEAELDRLMKIAESKGWAVDAFDAEMEGMSRHT